MKPHLPTYAFMTMALTAALTWAQAPTAPVLSLTATTDNVTGAHDAIRIDVVRWSTDAERDDLLNAWNLKTPPAARGGRGRAAAAAAPAPADDPNAGDAPPAPPAAARGGGRGGGGGGGRGRGNAAPEVPLTPETSLAAALEKAPTVGYLWSSEVAGYALRYATKIADPSGDRILFITDRRLGANNDRWNPVPSAPGAAPRTNEFSVIEIHFNPAGIGEGKTSLTGKVVIDSTTKTFGLENYAGLPAVLKTVKKK